MFKCINKSILLAALCCFSIANSYAHISKPYFTGQLGYANVHSDTDKDITATLYSGLDMVTVKIHEDVEGDGFTARVAAGLPLNHLFSIELGAAVYPSAEQDAHVTQPSKVDVKLTEFENVFAVDLLAKMSTRFYCDKYSVYFGAGPVLVYTKRSSDIQLHEGCYARLSGEIVMGVNYHFDSCYSASVNLGYIFEHGDPIDDHDYVPAIGFITVGVTMHL